MNRVREITLFPFERARDVFLDHARYGQRRIRGCALNLALFELMEELILTEKVDEVIDHVIKKSEEKLEEGVKQLLAEKV